MSASTTRAVPNLPVRTAAVGPPPVLPPRQTETPHEHTPEGPPSYGDAVASNGHNLNGPATDRLSRAGVSVPDLGIGSPTQSHTQQGSGSMGHAGQLSELQQRFARMNASSPSRAAGSSTDGAHHPGTNSSPSMSSVASTKKKPPPPPMKRIGHDAERADLTSAPPIPTLSKPKPG